MVVDVATFVGVYPFRGISKGTPDWLLAQMDRLNTDVAWVGDLGAFLEEDPAASNTALSERLASFDRLLPVPTASLGYKGWRCEVERAHETGAPAVRVYPQYWNGVAEEQELVDLAAAAAEFRLPILLTVRFEDPRQRQPADRGSDLGGAVVRRLARAHPDVRLVVSHASRDLIEEVHFGLTPNEAGRVVWDVAWIWGPPEDHLARLWHTVGHERFVLGTGMPLRIPDATIAKLDLLEGGWERTRPILAANLERWRTIP